MFDIDPDRAGWWVAFSAFLLQGISHFTARTEAAKKKRDDHIRALAQAEIGVRFGGENGFDVKLARVEERLNGVYERLGSLDRKFDAFIGARLEDAQESDREQL